MKNYLIDVHAHIDDPKMILSPKEIIDQAKENGVEIIISASADEETSRKSLCLANKFDNVFCMIGVHPQDQATFDNSTENFLLESGKNSKVVAIGEIGLEYCFEPFDKERQKEVFLKQLEIANELSLPVQIHCREATKDMIDMLKSHKDLLKNGGIIHCFNGSKESAEEYFKLGLCISIGGILTFKNAGRVLEIAKWVPKDKVVLETDSPYLSPEPFRGKINTPANILFVAEKLAQVWGVTLEEVMKITTQNALRIFPRLVKNEKC